MDSLRNHEGYHDPTACRAIRNASRKERHGRDESSRPLTFRLEEVGAFRACTKRVP